MDEPFPTVGARDKTDCLVSLWQSAFYLSQDLSGIISDHVKAVRVRRKRLDLTEILVIGFGWVVVLGLTAV